jgi:hypothetical protein
MSEPCAVRLCLVRFFGKRCTSAKDLIFRYIQDCVQAAVNLRCDDDDDLPLVALVDDFYGVHTPMAPMGIQLNFIQISSWYHLMAISNPKVVRHALYATLENKTIPHPLMSTHVIYNMHMGLGSYRNEMGHLNSIS